MKTNRLPANEQTNALFKRRYENECRGVNQFMIWLMVAQWFAGIGFAVFYSPLTWIGQSYEIHVHIWAAILLGGAISGFAILWTRNFTDAAHSRHVIAICQVLWSALLIHLSGGRIETHFHVFASLAILSIYRDWKVLVTATVVVAIDHFVRGVFYPLSAFGIVAESPFRWIEHAAWVIFEVLFLAPGCIRLRNEIRELCVRQTEIEEAKATIETKVQSRTNELATATSMLDTVLQSIPEGIVALDGSGNFVCFNQQAEEILGKRRHDTDSPETWPVDFAMFDVDGVTQLKFDQLPLYQAMRGKVVTDREMVVRRSDNDVLISVNAKPLDSDATAGAVCIFRDITDERKREHKMRMLRAAVDNANEAMFTVNSEECFVGVNDFACNRLGYSRHELLSLSVRDICQKRPFSSWQEQWNTLKAKKHAVVEAEYVTKQGVVFPVEVSLMFVSYDGDEFIYAFARDISERKQAEDERSRLANELQEAARHAGMAEVATGVLHNVGNILNSVNVSASLIRKKFENSAFTNLSKASNLILEYQDCFADFVLNDARGQKLPNYIVKVTDALSDERDHVNEEFHDLLKNIEHIKEIVSVQQSMAKSSGVNQELYPQEIIDDVLAATKGSLVNHNIRVVRSDNGSIPAFVSDKHKILQILINLVGNAKDALVDYKIPDATIQICVKRLDDQAVFEVTDNGIGIPKENLEKVFQHGFTTKETGHGFGLHTCANAATELGGALIATSEGIGSGACFRLSLPFDNHPNNSSFLDVAHYPTQRLTK